MSEPEFTPPRYSGRESMQSLRLLFGLEYEEWMQDWPLEITDPARLGEFCDAYETGEFDTETRFGLMELILYALDDWLGITPNAQTEGEPLPQRVERLLQRDFLLHLHTIDYWRLAKEADADNVFQVTPLVRRVWDRCCHPEYSRWLASE